MGMYIPYMFTSCTHAFNDWLLLKASCPQSSSGLHTSCVFVKSVWNILTKVYYTYNWLFIAFHNEGLQKVLEWIEWLENYTYPLGKEANGSFDSLGFSSSSSSSGSASFSFF